MKGMLRCKFSPASNKLVSASMSFDTGAVLAQLHAIVKANKDAAGAALAGLNINCDEAAAAAVAASQADAIIDSLQMPRFVDSAVPAAVTVVQSSSVSESSGASHTSAEQNKADIISGDEESDSDSNVHEKDVANGSGHDESVVTAEPNATAAA